MSPLAASSPHPRPLCRKISAASVTGTIVTAGLGDSTFTLYSLLTSGYREEAEHWRRWLLRAIAGTPTQINIMYGISGERRLPEMELSWLAGYESSKPVRIGNAAHQQLQIDVFGEVMDTLNLAMRQGLPVDDDSWRIQQKLLSCVASHWMEPDEGIWEVRGGRQQFTHSKVMAWVAVDRAIKAVQNFQLKGPVDEWITLRERIRQDILANGYNEKLGTFVQTYGGQELDASLLMIGLVGFLKPDDPRLIGTIRAVERELVRDGLVIRYRPDAKIDGLAVRRELSRLLLLVGRQLRPAGAHRGGDRTLSAPDQTSQRRGALL